MIQVKSVSKIYRKKSRDIVALDRVDLKIGKGEWVSVSGHSGSGKSTLLMVLGGLVTPTSGTVHALGMSINDLSVSGKSFWRCRHVGFVFQSFYLIPYLSALENVQSAGLFAGNTETERAKELLVSMGLGHRLEHRPDELSVGQQQKVAVARALLNRPELLLADEPTGNLDPQSRQELMDIFHKVNSEGTTIVMVTHNTEVASHAPRKYLISEGKIAS